MKQVFSRFVNDESGATAIEYGLIAGLIGVVIISAVSIVGTSIQGKFTEVSTALGGSSTSGSTSGSTSSAAP